MRSEAEVREALKQQQDIKRECTAGGDFKHGVMAETICEVLQWVCGEDNGYGRMISDCAAVDALQKVN